MKEVEYFADRYNFNILVILDELFAANRHRLAEFSEAMQGLRERRKWNLSWWFQNHLSARFNEEDMRRAKQAGCHCIFWGVETFTSRWICASRRDE